MTLISHSSGSIFSVHLNDPPQNELLNPFPGQKWINPRQSRGVLGENLSPRLERPISKIIIITHHPYYQKYPMKVKDSMDTKSMQT